MPQLPVQSANIVANQLTSPPSGTRAETGSMTGEPAKSFSGMLKNELARSEQAASASRKANGQAPQATGPAPTASGSRETTTANPDEPDSAEDMAETGVDPAVAELIIALAASGQPIAPTGNADSTTPDPAVSSLSQDTVLTAPSLQPNLIQAPLQHREFPASPEAPPPGLALANALPEHAGSTNLATGSDHLADQLLSGQSGVDADQMSRLGNDQALQVTAFDALVERAANELGMQPAATHSGMVRELAHSYRIEAPAGQPTRWAQEIGDRVAWMVTSREQRAELVLNPPQLGRIEVTLAVNGDQANAWFSSPNSTVRELLETSLPRLREVMAESGIQLGQAQVGADSPGFKARGEEQRRDSASGIQNRADESGYVKQPAMASRISAGRGLVDIFA